MEKINLNKPYKESVTQEQYQNAKKHWEKLISGDISGKFSMEVYTSGGYREDINICGTSGCSIGYAPETLNLKYEDFRDFHGICGTSGCSLGYAPETLKLNFSEFKGTSVWSLWDYEKISEEVFGIPVHSDEWDWCFSDDWTEIDNSAKAAGNRMKVLFEEGLPDDWQEKMNRNEL